MREKVDEMKNNIGYCGLACSQCSEGISGQCQGCRQKSSECSIKKCCESNNINGCWSCSSFPCKEGMFNSLRVRAFVKCAREDGVEKLSEYLIKNREKGIMYHKPDGSKGDYDVLNDEDDVLKLLRTGAI